VGSAVLPGEVIGQPPPFLLLGRQPTVLLRVDLGELRLGFRDRPLEFLGDPAEETPVKIPP